MTAYSIVLKPVYSRPADSLPPGVTLPTGWDSLSWHQVETFNALSNPMIDVVFNTAMTGDGKSLAAYLAAMMNCKYTFAAYPTNELGRDQEKQVQGYKIQFKPAKDLQIYRLTAAILEEFIETNKLSSKLAGLLDRADNSEILLTNPDIFHYIHDFRYLRRNKAGQGDNADRLFAKIDNSYELFIFDEFHVFSSPQITSVLNAMLLIKHTLPGKKFLFLSATPNDLLQEFLSRCGLRYYAIDPVNQDGYRFSYTDKWRQISYPINLTFPQQLEPNLRSSYDWILENAETTILKFFQDHPGRSKGAIILNSIACVKKLVTKLKGIFAPLGLKVMENTGLTGETEKSMSVENADLLVGTSTIDVGVDFRINFLVFEAADAGNFIQRFGRLGRHKGFDIYQAYALLPNFIVERLFDADKHPLQNGETYDRITFSNAIRDRYGYVNEFKHYPKRWGGIQSACVHLELKRFYMQQTYSQSAEKFETDIENALGISIKQMYAQLCRCMEKEKKKIIEEARSFRGISQLDCGIYDATNRDEPEKERFKTYNLPSLLSNFYFEWMEKADFMEQAKKAGLGINRFDKALCYLKLTGYREVREDWQFYCSRDDLREIAKSGKVQILKDLEITGGSNDISKALSRRGLVCFISDRDRATLRAKLGLPIHFQAYGLSDRIHGKPNYTIAFGRSALLLETLIWHWKPQQDEGWIC